jgi:signal peptidase I
MDGNCSLKSGSTRRVVRRRVLCGSLFLCFASFAFSHWVLWPVKVTGDSMTPNYQDGQPNFINKLAYLSEAPQRGDVVGVRMGHGEFLLKRVIGLPGEKIEFNRGTIVVNGRPLVEPYVEKPLLWALPPVQLGPEDYFVMGDNRPTSMLGSVAKDHIVGKAVF